MCSSPIRGFHGVGGATFGSDAHVGPAAHVRIGRYSLQRQLPQLSELKPLMRLGSFTRIAPTGFTRFMHAGGETGGVLTADDARRALSVGADVLVVSNHGGRQLGRAPVSLTALAEVRDEVGPGACRTG